MLLPRKVYRSVPASWCTVPASSCNSRPLRTLANRTLVRTWDTGSLVHIDPCVRTTPSILRQENEKADLVLNAQLLSWEEKLTTIREAVHLTMQLLFVMGFGTEPLMLLHPDAIRHPYVHASYVPLADPVPVRCRKVYLWLKSLRNNLRAAFPPPIRSSSPFLELVLTIIPFRFQFVKVFLRS